MGDLSSDRIRQALCQHLESLQAAGVRQLPKARRGAVPAPTPNIVTDEPAPAAAKRRAAHPDDVLVQNADDEPAAAISTAPTLYVLQQEVAACTLCGELAATRTQTVYGVGNPRARLCFLGEAPGADEDRRGEPFVGRAGQLLDKMIVACRMRREDVYILNILKCRPPGNRNPLPDEAQNCRRYLDRQLELINPEFICCLGAVAAQNLLATTESIGRMRGKVLSYRGAKVVCTYHPAYLLRNPSAKTYAWDDLKFLMREMGTPLE
jgi:uracil-DNA glycosylase family 4